MPHILAIGVATLDIINHVASFPHEDAKVRATGQRICRGGNASNTLVMLSQLGHACAWGGMWVDEPDGQRILDDLATYHIDTTPSQGLAQGKVPTSYITLNQSNGSRTIVHHRDLPEFGLHELQQINLSRFDWIHFEGRNTTELPDMLRWVRQQAPHATLSVEIEKDHPDIEQAWSLADVLLFSRHFAQVRDWTIVQLFHHAQARTQARLCCAWGEEGAYAIDESQQLIHQAAFPPAQLVDTIGAGDTFNAGMIDALSQGKDMASSLATACALAGQKCGILGFQLLTEKHTKPPKAP